jgi:hypothetical protein
MLSLRLRIDKPFPLGALAIAAF